MQATPVKHDPTPWYRQFWPWFLLAILGWGVVSASITLAVAVGNPPQMMTGDYAKLGKALVDTHERADRAAALGLSGRLTLAGGEAVLAVEAVDLAGLDDALMLLVQHPTDAGQDRQLRLLRVAGGRYAAPSGDWPARGRLIVSDLEQRWWISSVYRVEDGRVEVRLSPERL